ncbi:MAG: bifunctional transaldolase/phosoglucose isomerase [Candidatus Omnitrophota bacterium]
MPSSTGIESPSSRLLAAGQSPWLDFISRDILTSGKLKKMIQESGLRGVTSNPTIFEKAINHPQSDYAREIAHRVQKGSSALQIYDALSIADIQKACDLFLPVFKDSRGADGFVSLEVVPTLAHDENATVVQALRLHATVKRPNLMIKVPATAAGVHATRRLIARGISVNATLIFSVRQYREIAVAYQEGLQELVDNGGDPSNVHSVASVFVSRWDTHLDQQLALLLKGETDPGKAERIRSLQGKAAVANAKLIYQEFKRLFSGERFGALAARGARIQRPLWASTSTKNPHYPELIYVTELIGAETVNTMPLATLEAFLCTGDVPAGRIETELQAARDVLQKIEALGLGIEAAGDYLQREGLRLFCESFYALIRSIEKNVQKRLLERVKGPAQVAIDHPWSEREDFLELLGEMEEKRCQARFYEKDPTLWKEEESHQKVIRNRLGWIPMPEWMLGRLYEIDALREEITKEGYRHLVLLGMGGSSLAPEVMHAILPRTGNPLLTFSILDTTTPEGVAACRKNNPPSRTLYLVASKSGSTVETVSQYYFFHRELIKYYGGENPDNLRKAGRHFIAITDEGSWLERTAADRYFRKTFLNPSDIGGRYSALSYFGCVPALLAGLPAREMIATAAVLSQASQAEVSLGSHPAFRPAALLAGLAATGKNHMVFMLSKKLGPFGAWLEQLIAESTGKEGKGILPVIADLRSELSSFGDRAVFVFMAMKGDRSKEWAARLNECKSRGLPYLVFEWPTPSALGAEFLRWEIITSVIGITLGINPFDEPNVKESKDITGKLLETLKRTGHVPEPDEMITHKRGGWNVGKKSMDGKRVLQNFSKKLETAEYLALLAYVARHKSNAAILQKAALALQKKLKKPVIVGFGPRYLHSIGQLYKGGPKTGAFIEILTDDAIDLPVPDSHFTFGELKKAQALGDFEALASKNLPVILLHGGASMAKTIGSFLRTV